MLSVLIAPILLTAAAAPPTPNRCTVEHLAACQNTNVLLLSVDMEDAMARFLGRHAADRVSYVRANGYLIDQILDVLGGPPDDRRDLPGGGYVFTACRPHSCMEKGAVAFDAGGRINAVGLLSFHCGRSPKGCSDGRTLDVYVKNDSARIEESKAANTEWATAAAADSGSLHDTFEGVILHKIGNTTGR